MAIFQGLIKFNLYYYRFIVMFLSLIGSVFLTLSGWYSVQSEHFTVHYQKEDRYVVEEVADFLEEEYEELATVFGARIREEVDVYIHPDQHSMVEITRVQNPSRWLVGLAINGREIHIVSPLNPPTNHSKESVFQGMAHELVHICVYKMLPHRLPLWLNEGLAVYYARQRQFAREVPGILRSRPFLPSFEELSDQLSFERNKGYPLSYTIIEFLVHEFGEYSLQKFLVGYPDYSALGFMSSMQLEAAWHQYLDSRYLNPPPLQKWMNYQQNVFEVTFTPNPVDHKARLDFVTTDDQIFQLLLLDPWGDPMQKIFQRPLRGGFHGFEIDASQFPAGVYYLELSAGNDLQLIRFEKR